MFLSSILWTQCTIEKTPNDTYKINGNYNDQTYTLQAVAYHTLGQIWPQNYIYLSHYTAIVDFICNQSKNKLKHLSDMLQICPLNVTVKFVDIYIPHMNLLPLMMGPEMLYTDEKQK